MRDMFPGYYQPTEREFEKLWSEGLVVLDANVLLDMYRFTPKTREEMFTLLEQLGERDQVWVPHQAASEYQFNRADVIYSQRRVYADLRKDLAKAREILEREEGDLDQHVVGAFEALRTYISDVEQRHPDVSLGADRVRERLDALLEGRVGPPYTADTLEEKKEAAARRYEGRVPPGYKDAGEKSGDREYGDAILWFQTLDKAEGEERPVLLVTSEEKEDWWLIGRGDRTLGPRPELVVEMREGPGVVYYQYNPDRFLEFGSEYFGKPASEEAVEEIRSLPRLLPVEGRMSRLNDIRQRKAEAQDELAHASEVYENISSSLDHIEALLRRPGSSVDERSNFLAEARELRDQQEQASEQRAQVRHRLHLIEAELSALEEEMERRLPFHEHLIRTEEVTREDLRRAIRRRLGEN